MGSTWLRKLHSNGRLMPETTTLAVAVCSPTRAVIVVWPSCAGTTSAVDHGGNVGIARGPRYLFGHLAPGFVALELLQDQPLPAFTRAELARRRATARIARRRRSARLPGARRNSTSKGDNMPGHDRRAPRRRIGCAEPSIKRRAIDRPAPSALRAAPGGFKRAHGFRDGRRRPGETAGRPAQAGWFRG